LYGRTALLPHSGWRGTHAGRRDAAARPARAGPYPGRGRAAEAAIFSPAGRGYDREQVDAHVAALEQELAELRWEHEDLAGQRQALAVQRAQQARGTPSFTALGERVVQLVRLAEEEACALRTAATKEANSRREQAAAAFAALAQGQAETLAADWEAAQRALRVLADNAQYRRRLLEAELAQVRRDAELQVAGLLARAAARAQDVRDEAEREATAALDAARAEVIELQGRRDALVAELMDLSRRLAGTVQRLGVPPAGAIGPLIG